LKHSTIQSLIEHPFRKISVLLRISNWTRRRAYSILLHLSYREHAQKHCFAWKPLISGRIFACKLWKTYCTYI